MECLLIGSRHDTTLPALLLEDADERWRCRLYGQPSPPPDVLLLFPCDSARRLAAGLEASPPPHAPWMIACGRMDVCCDAAVSPDDLAVLPALVDHLEQTTLPRLCLARLPRTSELAAQALHSLEIRPTLTAWRFLPFMTAVAALHPAALSDLSHRLYVLTGAQCGMRPAAVERSLRLAVESAWSRSRLSALEEVFGQSIDPDRGKPTNLEFLCRMGEAVQQMAARETLRFPSCCIPDRLSTVFPAFC